MIFRSSTYFGFLILALWSCSSVVVSSHDTEPPQDINMGFDDTPSQFDSLPLQDSSEDSHLSDSPVQESSESNLSEILENLPVFERTLAPRAGFVEQFTDDWKSRWIVSTALRKEDGNKSFYYVGEWAVEEPRVFKGIKGDKGLVLKTVAAHHAISAKFNAPVNNKGKTLVVQYEVKLQNDLDCGGAYLKLLTESLDDIRHQEFSDQTPYTIMFGPDKCGTTNKVHFIFRHKNPITNKYEEKHLRSPPLVTESSLTTLYRLIVWPNQTFQIQINKVSERMGSLLTDFDPPVNPEKTIADPNDKKPIDWVDDPKMFDLNAKKPDDWDETEPLEIPDLDAVKPEDWLDHEPSMIPDPNVKKPEEWNDDEDGDFIAPLIENPRCQKVSGCGAFKPMKPNPNYKGKWTPPLIDNPKYIGPWEPRKIPNPEYFEDKSPSNFETLIGVGFELWTMQNDILFDNIYIGHSLEDADEFTKRTFDVKYYYESSQEKKSSDEDVLPEKETPSQVVIGESYLNFIMGKVVTFVGLVKKDPVLAIKEMPGTASTIGAIFVTFLALLYGLITLISSSNKVSTETKRTQTKAVVEEQSKANEDSDADVSSNSISESIEVDGLVSSKRRTVKRTE